MNHISRMDSRVELRDVGKLYNGSAPQPALNGVTLDIAAGEFAAVMGPSGSGKSTLLNLIAGLDRPTQGRITVDGVDLGRLSEADLARYRRTHVGFVFQFFNLLNNLTVLDNVLIPAQLAGVKRQTAHMRAQALLEELDIADKARQFPARLSGGQRQRVAIARALINQPTLLLADEPTGALDSRSGDEVMRLVEELHRRGQTILLVTHDAKLAARYAARVITLRDGTVVDDTRLVASPVTLTGDLVRVKVEGRGR